MRNTLQYPVTTQEIVDCLEQLAGEVDDDAVGDMRPLILAEAVKAVKAQATAQADRERLLSSPWPMRASDPAWADDAAAFVALVCSNPAVSQRNGHLKFLTVHVDTRSGHFTLTDREEKAVTAETVLATLREAEPLREAALKSLARQRASA